MRPCSLARPAISAVAAFSCIPAASVLSLRPCALRMSAFRLSVFRPCRLSFLRSFISGTSVRSGLGSRVLRRFALFRGLFGSGSFLHGLLFSRGPLRGLPAPLLLLKPLIRHLGLGRLRKRLDQPGLADQELSCRTSLARAGTPAVLSRGLGGTLTSRPVSSGSRLRIPARLPAALLSLLGLHLTVVRVTHKNDIFLLFRRRLLFGALRLLFGALRLFFGALCLLLGALRLDFLLHFLLFRHIAHSHLSLCHYPLFSFALAKMFPYFPYCLILYGTLGGFCFHPFLLQKCDDVPALYAQLFCQFKNLSLCHAAPPLLG